MARCFHDGHGIVEENLLEVNSVTAEDLIARFEASPASDSMILGELDKDSRLPFGTLADAERNGRG